MVCHHAIYDCNQCNTTTTNQPVLTIFIILYANRKILFFFLVKLAFLLWMHFVHSLSKKNMMSDGDSETADDDQK